VNGESSGAFALATKLLHPRPKAMGVEQQSAVFETGRDFRFLAVVAREKVSYHWHKASGMKLDLGTCWIWVPGTCRSPAGHAAIDN